MRILKFALPTCGPCRMISTRLQQGGVKYEDIDASDDDGAELAARYNVSHVPVVIVLDDNGRVSQRYDTIPDIIEAIPTLAAAH